MESGVLGFGGVLIERCGERVEVSGGGDREWCVGVGWGYGS